MGSKVKARELAQKGWRAGGCRGETPREQSDAAIAMRRDESASLSS
jgi:hypothetical protein